MNKIKKKLLYCNCIVTRGGVYQDLSFGGRPTWSLACEKNIFHMHVIKKIKKGTCVGIQNDFQNMFNIYDSIYGLLLKSLY